MAIGSDGGRVRIPVTEKIRAAMQSLPLPPSCTYCGNDLDLHEWVEVPEGDDANAEGVFARGAEIMNCDYADG